MHSKRVQRDAINHSAAVWTKVAKDGPKVVRCGSARLLSHGAGGPHVPNTARVVCWGFCYPDSDNPDKRTLEPKEHPRKGLHFFLYFQVFSSQGGLRV